MKILVACEESQAVTIAMRNNGHEAYSCDLLPCSGGHPEWHKIMDVRSAMMKENYDLIIAHPPCTYLAVSGNRWMTGNLRRYRSRLDAIDFFFDFVFNQCEKIAVEQPKGIMSSVYRRPDQIIQPWQFGHGETKATHLWLKGLPALRPTNIVTGRSDRIFRNIGPGPDRQKIRSKTYPGIAQAMADQWAPKI